MEEKELKDVLKSRIESDFKEQFNKGLIAGWDSCVLTINKQIANMTSAKAIKKLIGEKADEVNNRIKKQ